MNYNLKRDYNKRETKADKEKEKSRSKITL